MIKKKIIEIGFEVTPLEMSKLLNTIAGLGLPYYIEPSNRFNSLADLECQCEGK